MTEQLLPQPSPSPPSGDEASPSPDLLDHPDAPASVNASPLSASSSLYASAPDDHSHANGDPSSSDTRPNGMAEVTRTPSVGKGGCWTCRVRRKKCDEEREGDSCKTCLRLRIQCLGWGPKRPDWMRDKEKVAAYKSGIKEQLSRAGLIRGQPRQQWQTGAISAAQSSVGGVAGPSGVHASVRRGPREVYRRPHSWGMSAPYHVPTMSPAPHSGDDFSFLPHPSMSPAPAMADPMYGPSPAFYSASATSSPAMPLHAVNMNVHEDNDLPYSSMFPSTAPSGFDAPAAVSHPHPGTSSIIPPPRQQEYILYYFENVRPIQYIFAGDSLTSILYSIVMAEPDGAVALSLCALAALHHARVRMAQGISSGGTVMDDPDAENSVPRHLYNTALYQLMQARSYSGHYTEHDAVAALQLVMYTVFAGGATDWAAPLDIACAWLSQTGIVEDENPKLTLLNMTPAARFAAKATMWIDIFSSMTFMQPPRYLALYRRLFGGGAGYWAANSGGPPVSPRQAELSFEGLTGCPDEALLAIAEISALAHWKVGELQAGSLSTRELLRRGDLIEAQLRRRSAERQKEELEEAKLAMGLDASGLAMAAGSSSSAAAAQEQRMEKDTPRRIIGNMFRDTTVLYLHTVLNDSSPAVAEIASTVDGIVKHLNDLPPSPLDRALLFPLYLVGCMTDSGMLREVVKHRFFMQDASIGNVLLAQTLMENMWVRRQNLQMRRANTSSVGLHTAGDWRESLKDRWASLLLL